ncbi:Dynamin family-domain-containing protein [Gaertneriomyces semiglobifer]|nr:Dynamin family-domain-containing protein [Gaertneriomyces semiglobifer]
MLGDCKLGAGGRKAQVSAEDTSIPTSKQPTFHFNSSSQTSTSSDDDDAGLSTERKPTEWTEHNDVVDNAATRVETTESPALSSPSRPFNETTLTPLGKDDRGEYQTGDVSCADLEVSTSNGHAQDYDDGNSTDFGSDLSGNTNSRFGQPFSDSLSTDLGPTADAAFEIEDGDKSDGPVSTDFDLDLEINNTCADDSESPRFEQVEKESSDFGYLWEADGALFDDEGASEAGDSVDLNDLANDSDNEGVFQTSVASYDRFPYNGSHLFAEECETTVARREFEVADFHYSKSANTLTDGEASDISVPDENERITTGLNRSGASCHVNRVDESRHCAPGYRGLGADSAAVDESSIAALPLFFKEEPTADCDTFPTHQQLEDSMPFYQEEVDDSIIESLERICRDAADLLSSLHQYISSMGTSSEAENWLRRLVKLQETAAPPKAVVAVVGATGAGKSSLINALLDKAVLPTNCMRACTAVVTEIKYNEESSDYEAEVEFLSKDEWTSEMNLLLETLEASRNSKGDVRGINDRDSAAGKAWARLKAVYPSITKQELTARTREELVGYLCQLPICRMLGKKRIMKHTDLERFTKDIAVYIDSNNTKQPTLANALGRKHSEKHTTEFWPLIKVISMKLRCAVLRSGTVIVDLPGVQDANVVRAGVAERYMKNCQANWVVAPINRAVDDKTAQTLLDESFKRQLLMDGNYTSTSITFICTKADALSSEEVKRSLGLEEELSELQERINGYWTRLKNAEKDEIRARRNYAKLKTAAQDAQLEKRLWARSLESCKRAAEPVSPPSTKRRKGDRGGAPLDVVTPQRPDSDEESRPNIHQLREAAEAADAAWKKKHAHYSDARRILVHCELERRKQEEKYRESLQEERRLCAGYRNTYVKHFLPQVFQAGLNEILEEIEQERNPDSWNPSELSERTLDVPVFTVSTTEYNRLTSKYPPNAQSFCTHDAHFAMEVSKVGDNDGATVYNSPAETEIPALRQHARALGERTRRAHAERFVNDVCQLLADFKMILSSDATVSSEDVTKFISDATAQLEVDLRGCSQWLSEQLSILFHVEFGPHLDSGARIAEKHALETTQRWGSKPDIGHKGKAPSHKPDGHCHNGGYPYSTYKAVCRRDGVFEGGKYGHIDFNADLANPMLNAVSSPWHHIMNIRVPRLLACWKADHVQLAYEKLLDHLRREVQRRPAQFPSNMADLLQHLQAGLTSKCEQQVQYVGDLIREAQKDITRQIVPTVQGQMLGAYKAANSVTGPGAFERMKGHIQEHVDAHVGTIFSTAVVMVHNELAAMVQKVSTLVHIQQRTISDWLTEMLPTWSEQNGALHDRSKEELLKFIIIEQSKCDDLIKSVYFFDMAYRAMTD